MAYLQHPDGPARGRSRAMADGPMERQGRTELEDERGGGWRRRLHTRLSLLACDEEGSDGRAGLRDRGMGSRPSLPDDDGHGTEEGEGPVRRHADAGDGGRLRDGDERDRT